MFKPNAKVLNDTRVVMPEIVHFSAVHKGFRYVGDVDVTDMDYEYFTAPTENFTYYKLMALVGEDQYEMDIKSYRLKADWYIHRKGDAIVVRQPSNKDPYYFVIPLEFLDDIAKATFKFRYQYVLRTEMIQSIKLSSWKPLRAYNEPYPLEWKILRVETELDTP